MLFNKLIPRRKKSSCQQADLLYIFPVLLYIYSDMRMAMMDGCIFHGYAHGYASLLPDRHDDAYGVYHHANEHGCE